MSGQSEKWEMIVKSDNKRRCAGPILKPDAEQSLALSRRFIDEGDDAMEIQKRRPDHGLGR